MKTKVYLSDPCTGYDREERERTFGSYEGLFVKLGFEVFNPLKNGLDPHASWSEHMRKDLAVLTECGTLLRLSGRRSPGVDLELQVAAALGIKVVTSDQLMRTPLDGLDSLLTP